MLLFTGGPVYTMDLLRPTAGAVLVRGERIAAVGEEARLRALAPAAEEIDLDGRALLPGFVDAHSHLAAAAYRSLLADLAPPPVGPCRTPADVAAALGAFLQAHPPGPGQWLMGMGYDESAQGGRPTRQMLDQISRQVPIAAVHRSGHLCVCNSRALALLGKEAADGLLAEGAFLDPAVQRRMRGPGEEEMVRAVGATARVYAAAGYTTVQEARADAALLPLLEGANRRGLLPVDVAAYLPVELARQHPPDRAGAVHYRGRLRRAGCKLFLDGSPQGRTAWLTRPYHQSPPGEGAGYCGAPALTDAALFAHLDECAANAWPVQVHVNGDAALDQLLRVWARVCRRRPGAAAQRPVAVHCQTARGDQLSRMPRLGLIPSFFVEHIVHWGEFYRAVALGEERAETISPVGLARRLHLPYTLHQDCPVLPPHPLAMVQAAALRRTAAGRVLGDDLRVPAAEAIFSLCQNAAWQLFEQGRKGCLRPGYQADLTIWPADPLTAAPDRLSALRPALVYSRGRRVET